MRTFLVENLGCKVNAYESDAIANMLEDRGYILDRKSPDLIIVNTCSVTATSDSKSRQKIRRLIKDHPNALVCVMGCYSQLHPEVVEAIIKASPAYTVVDSLILNGYFTASLISAVV